MSMIYINMINKIINHNIITSSFTALVFFRYTLKLTAIICTHTYDYYTHTHTHARVQAHVSVFIENSYLQRYGEYVIFACVCSVLCRVSIIIIYGYYYYLLSYGRNVFTTEIIYRSARARARLYQTHTIIIVSNDDDVNVCRACLVSEFVSSHRRRRLDCACVGGAMCESACVIVFFLSTRPFPLGHVVV